MTEHSVAETETRLEGPAQDLEYAALFLAGRLALVLSLPIDALRGYGDLVHFYHLAQLGAPYLELWVEFPPVFPFLSYAFANLAGSAQHVYDYLLIFTFSVAQAGALLVFGRIARAIGADEDQARRRTLWYLIFLLSLPYGWWYFDALAVLPMLLGLLWLLRDQASLGGLMLGLGALTKWFPILGLTVAWQRLARGKAVRASALAGGVIALAIGALFLTSPDFTLASLQSQLSKGSWETVWALLDGNLGTGNFGPEAERLDPKMAAIPRGNPPRVPSWITLIPFAGLGFILLRHARTDGASSVRFLGLAWCLFLLWSPGWSPQWILYLLPLILLALPPARAASFGINLTLLALLEWPILLSRGRFDLLWVPVLLRTAVLVLLAVEFGRLSVRLPATLLRREVA